MLALTETGGFPAYRPPKEIEMAILGRVIEGAINTLELRLGEKQFSIPQHQVDSNFYLGYNLSMIGGSNINNGQPMRDQQSSGPGKPGEAPPAESLLQPNDQISPSSTTTPGSRSTTTENQELQDSEVTEVDTTIASTTLSTKLHHFSTRVNNWLHRRRSSVLSICQTDKSDFAPQITKLADSKVS